MLLKGVIFDMDGTLIDSMEMWHTLSSRYILDNNKIPEINLDKKIEKLSVYDGAIYLAKNYNLDKSPNQIIEEIDAIIKDYYFNMVKLKPYAYEYLKKLKDNNIKIGLATVTDLKFVLGALNKLNIAHFFDDIATCSMVGRGKEFSDVYDYSLESIKTSKEDTVVFEDSFYAIKTAKMAGYKIAFVKDNYSKNEWEKSYPFSDYIVTSYKDFYNTII